MGFRSTGPGGNRTAGWAIFIAAALGVVLVGIISWVLWNYYQSQVNLKTAALEGFRGGLERRASAVSYYFMERSGDIKGLVESKALENYFANKALGMSMAYGLRASLDQLGDTVQDILNQKKMSAQPVYRRIVIMDENREMLTDIRGNGAGFAVPESVGELSRIPPDTVQINVLETDTGNAICIAASVYFKGEYHGNLFAWIDLNLLYHNLISKNRGQRIETYFLSHARDDRCLPILISHDTQLAACLEQTHCKTGKAIPVTSDSSQSTGESLMVFNVPVSETAFYLSALITSEYLAGASAPKEIVSLLGVLVLILLAAVTMLFWVGHRNIVLNTRVAEEEKYRYFVENAQDIIYSTDSHGNFTYVSSASKKLLEVMPEDLIGKNFQELFLPEAREEVWRFYKDQYEQQRHTTYRELPIRTRSGVLRWLGQNVQIELVDGVVRGFRAVARDITDLKQTRDLLQQAHDELEERIRKRTQDLKASNDRLAAEIMEKEAAKLAFQEQLVFLQNLIDTIPIPIFYKNNEGVYLGCNHAFEQYLGVLRDRIIGNTSAGLGHHEPSIIFQEPNTDEADRQSIENYEARVQHSDGRIQNIIINKAVYIDSTLQPAGHVCVIMDITERKRLEGKLLQVQKLESIGGLAAGIAHEINTPIQFIGDNTRFLSDSFKDLLRLLESYEALADTSAAVDASSAMLANLETLREQMDIDFLISEIPLAIEQTREGVMHVTKIVRSMKEFSHPGTGKKTDTDINRAIENTIVVARNEWKYRAEMITDLSPELPMVPCLAGEFNQVILNLIVNAVHAISEAHGENSDQKGTITISTRHMGNRIEIRVSDTGTGIPEQIRDRIFDPFFTTKEVGRGTGQGLSVARSVIVDKHGGQLSFETETGRGSTFIIHLPVRVADGEARLEMSH